MSASAPDSPDPSAAGLGAGAAASLLFSPGPVPPHAPDPSAGLVTLSSPAALQSPLSQSPTGVTALFSPAAPQSSGPSAAAAALTPDRHADLLGTLPLLSSAAPFSPHAIALGHYPLHPTPSSGLFTGSPAPSLLTPPPAFQHQQRGPSGGGVGVNRALRFADSPTHPNPSTVSHSPPDPIPDWASSSQYEDRSATVPASAKEHTPSDDSDESASENEDDENEDELEEDDNEEELQDDENEEELAIEDDDNEEESSGEEAAAAASVSTGGDRQVDVNAAMQYAFDHPVEYAAGKKTKLLSQAIWAGSKGLMRARLSSSVANMKGDTRSEYLLALRTRAPEAFADIMAAIQVRIDLAIRKWESLWDSVAQSLTDPVVLQKLQAAATAMDKIWVSASGKARRDADVIVAALDQSPAGEQGTTPVKAAGRSKHLKRVKTPKMFKTARTRPSQAATVADTREVIAIDDDTALPGPVHKADEHKAVKRPPSPRRASGGAAAAAAGAAAASHAAAAGAAAASHAAAAGAAAAIRSESSSAVGAAAIRSSSAGGASALRSSSAGGASALRSSSGRAAAGGRAAAAAGGRAAAAAGGVADIPSSGAPLHDLTKTPQWKQHSELYKLMLKYSSNDWAKQLFGAESASVHGQRLTERKTFITQSNQQLFAPSLGLSIKRWGSFVFTWKNAKYTLWCQLRVDGTLGPILMTKDLYFLLTKNGAVKASGDLQRELQSYAMLVRMHNLHYGQLTSEDLGELLPTETPVPKELQSLLAAANSVGVRATWGFVLSPMALLHFQLWAVAKEVVHDADKWNSLLQLLDSEQSAFEHSLPRELLDAWKQGAGSVLFEKYHSRFSFLAETFVAGGYPWTFICKQWKETEAMPKERAHPSPYLRLEQALPSIGLAAGRPLPTAGAAATVASTVSQWTEAQQLAKTEFEQFFSQVKAADESDPNFPAFSPDLFHRSWWSQAWHWYAPFVADRNSLFWVTFRAHVLKQLSEGGKDMLDSLQLAQQLYTPELHGPPILNVMMPEFNPVMCRILPYVLMHILDLKSSKRNILLSGRPGLGKTHAVQQSDYIALLQCWTGVLAALLKYNFIRVSASHIRDQYLGQSEKRIRAMFLAAMAMAPCIVCLDECDGLLAAQKSGQIVPGQSHDAQIEKEFLQHMGDIIPGTSAELNLGVIVVGTLNFAGNLSAAMLSRFAINIDVSQLHQRDEYYLSGMLSIIQTNKDPLQPIDVLGADGMKMYQEAKAAAELGGGMDAVEQARLTFTDSPLYPLLQEVHKLNITDWRIIEYAIAEAVKAGRNVRQRQELKQIEALVADAEPSTHQHIISQWRIAQSVALVRQPLPSVFLDPATAPAVHLQFAISMENKLHAQESAPQAEPMEDVYAASPVRGTMMTPVHPRLTAAPPMVQLRTIDKGDRSELVAATVATPVRITMQPQKLVPTQEQLQRRIGKRASTVVKNYGERLHRVQDLLDTAASTVEAQHIDRRLNWSFEDWYSDGVTDLEEVRIRVEELHKRRADIWAADDNVLITALKELHTAYTALQKEEFNEMMELHQSDAKYPKPMPPAQVNINHLRFGTGGGTGLLFHLTQQILQHSLPAQQETYLHRLQLLTSLSSEHKLGHLADTYVDSERRNALLLAVDTEAWYVRLGDISRRRIDVLKSLLELLTSSGVMTATVHDEWLSRAVEVAHMQLRDPEVVNLLLERGGSWASLLIINAAEYKKWTTEQFEILQHLNVTRGVVVQPRDDIFSTRTEALQASTRTVERLRALKQAAPHPSPRTEHALQKEEDAEEEEEEDDDEDAAARTQADDEAAERGALLSLTALRDEQLNPAHASSSALLIYDALRVQSTASKHASPNEVLDAMLQEIERISEQSLNSPVIYTFAISSLARSPPALLQVAFMHAVDTNRLASLQAIVHLLCNQPQDMQPLDVAPMEVDAAGGAFTAPVPPIRTAPRVPLSTEERHGREPPIMGPTHHGKRLLAQLLLLQFDGEPMLCRLARTGTPTASVFSYMMQLYNDRTIIPEEAVVLLREAKDDVYRSSPPLWWFDRKPPSRPIHAAEDEAVLRFMMGLGHHLLTDREPHRTPTFNECSNRSCVLVAASAVRVGAVHALCAAFPSMVSHVDDDGLGLLSLLLQGFHDLPVNMRRTEQEEDGQDVEGNVSTFAAMRVVTRAEEEEQSALDMQAFSSDVLSGGIHCELTTFVSGLPWASNNCWFEVLLLLLIQLLQHRWWQVPANNQWHQQWQRIWTLAQVTDDLPVLSTSREGQHDHVNSVFKELCRLIHSPSTQRVREERTRTESELRPLLNDPNERFTFATTQQTDPREGLEQLLRQQSVLALLNNQRSMLSQLHTDMKFGQVTLRECTGCGHKSSNSSEHIVLNVPLTDQVSSVQDRVTALFDPQSPPSTDKLICVDECSSRADVQNWCAFKVTNNAKPNSDETKVKQHQLDAVGVQQYKMKISPRTSHDLLWHAPHGKPPAVLLMSLQAASGTVEVQSALSVPFIAADLDKNAQDVMERLRPRVTHYIYRLVAIVLNRGVDMASHYTIMLPAVDPAHADYFEYYDAAGTPVLIPQEHVRAGYFKNNDGTWVRNKYGRIVSCAFEFVGVKQDEAAQGELLREAKRAEAAQRISELMNEPHLTKSPHTTSLMDVDAVFTQQRMEQLRNGAPLVPVAMGKPHPQHATLLAHLLKYSPKIWLPGSSSRNADITVLSTSAASACLACQHVLHEHGLRMTTVQPRFHGQGDGGFIVTDELAQRLEQIAEDEAAVEQEVLEAVLKQTVAAAASVQSPVEAAEAEAEADRRPFQSINEYIQQLTIPLPPNEWPLQTNATFALDAVAIQNDERLTLMHKEQKLKAEYATGYYCAMCYHAYYTYFGFVSCNECDRLHASRGPYLPQVRLCGPCATKMEDAVAQVSLAAFNDTGQMRPAADAPVKQIEEYHAHQYATHTAPFTFASTVPAILPGTVHCIRQISHQVTNYYRYNVLQKGGATMYSRRIVHQRPLDIFSRSMYMAQMELSKKLYFFIAYKQERKKRKKTLKRKRMVREQQEEQEEEDKEVVVVNKVQRRVGPDAPRAMTDSIRTIAAEAEERVSMALGQATSTMMHHMPLTEPAVVNPSMPKAFEQLEALIKGQPVRLPNYDGVEIRDFYTLKRIAFRLRNELAASYRNSTINRFQPVRLSHVGSSINRYSLHMRLSDIPTSSSSRLSLPLTPHPTLLVRALYPELLLAAMAVGIDDLRVKPVLTTGIPALANMRTLRQALNMLPTLMSTALNSHPGIRKRQNTQTALPPLYTMPGQAPTVYLQQIFNDGRFFVHALLQHIIGVLTQRGLPDTGVLDWASILRNMTVTAAAVAPEAHEAESNVFALPRLTTLGIGQSTPTIPTLMMQWYHGDKASVMEESRRSDVEIQQALQPVVNRLELILSPAPPNAREIKTVAVLYFPLAPAKVNEETRGWLPDPDQQLMVSADSNMQPVFTITVAGFPFYAGGTSNRTRRALQVQVSVRQSDTVQQVRNALATVWPYLPIEHDDPRLQHTPMRLVQSGSQTGQSQQPLRVGEDVLLPIHTLELLGVTDGAVFIIVPYDTQP